MASPSTNSSNRFSIIRRAANFTNTPPTTASETSQATNFVEAKHESPSCLLVSSLRSVCLCVNFFLCAFHHARTSEGRARAFAFLPRFPPEPLPPLPLLPRSSLHLPIP